MILNHQRCVRVHLGRLRAFFGRVQKTLRVPKEAVTICLVDEEIMARWNRAYRGKQGPTDVLSFPADGNGRNVVKQGKQSRQRKQRTKSRTAVSSSASFGSSDCSTSYFGDIAVAPAVARRNARRFGRSLEDELRILILHGVLHLLGYDHETDHGEMERRERRLRRRLGLG